MVKRKAGVASSIKQAEELVENNQTDRKEDGAQQIQKLRFNVSDLKIRFNAVRNIKCIIYNIWIKWDFPMIKIYFSVTHIQKF